MSDELEQLVQSAQADIAACADARTLETLRVDLLGKKGRVTDLLKQLGGMAPEARKAFGEQVNRAKEALSSALETRGDELARIALAARLASERIDRSETRRVGKECGSTCRSRGTRNPKKNTNSTTTPRIVI